ncbi:hypothetical protein HG536_0A06930 [Torulaspora globosa]|uniref:Uncharacterized protein n=1 Tax=Torulaspora globosa TaxID=48254 RepID=A0A7G3ZBJ2_9SACH|nr:uncharacterized protein HG536_0A06930 [Torulaspora globosa]QLL30878.1 hypothetical protein HG536_0A06930 [Torulaspora globosa]
MQHLRSLPRTSATIGLRFIRNMSELTAARSADDAGGYSRRNGAKNQSITKPISLDETSGEVLVRKATGKTKVRKGQSDEEYQNQLYQHFQVEGGPKRTEIGWMDNVQPMDLLKDPNEHFEVKLTRQKLSDFCRRLYYHRDYAKCAELCDELVERYQPLNKKNKIAREIQELEFMAESSRRVLRIDGLNENLSNVHV